MHRVIKEHFSALFARFPPGHDVLEVGASEVSARELSIELPGRDYVGVNMLAAEVASGDGWHIVQGNGNGLTFPDASFDAVISNASLEHDAHFWLTVGEIHRVLRPGGLCFLGVPAFARRASRRSAALARIEYLLPYGHRLASSRMYGRLLGTSTYPFHAAPHDYYRFSTQAVREVLFAGYDVLALDEVFMPPRAIGVGRKI